MRYGFAILKIRFASSFLFFAMFFKHKTTKVLKNSTDIAENSINLYKFAVMISLFINYSISALRYIYYILKIY